MISLPNLRRWSGLIALSALLIGGLELLHLPAAMLLGAMAAGVVFGARGAVLAIPRGLFLGAQAVIGMMVAGVMPLTLLREVASDWPIFVAGVVSVVVAATGLGWLLARWQVLPGTTAIWGSAPGAATAMTLMAADYDADIRLVAFMQYLRVVVVAVVATIVARIHAPSGPAGAAAIDWFPRIDPLDLAGTVALIVVGAVGGRVLRLPAGPLLLPMVLGIVLHNAGLIHITLAPWLLAPAYALIGWAIGLRFDRAILRHALGALPRVLAAILCLVGLCALMAAALVRFAGVSPLTAYLATSPGGADSVAIIAASSKVDVPFVMAMQTARFVVVLLTGPAIARFVARHVPPRRSGT